MGIARAFFEWQRGFRHSRWFYNTRKINVENGRKAVAQLLVMGQHLDLDSMPKEGISREQVETEERAMQSHEPAQASAQEAGNGRISTQLDSTMPAEISEIRQAYESKSIDFVDTFRDRTKKILGLLEACSEKGLANMGLLRSDLYSYLRTFGFILRYKILVWTLFVLGLIVLTILDIAPTLLVFEGLMEGDTVSIGRLLGISDERMRDLIMALATTGFLAGVVMMGHVVAKLIASTYLDGEVPTFGIGLAIVVLSIFVIVAGLRFQNELRTQEENYAAYVKDFERKAALGTSGTKDLLTLDQWKPGYMGRAAFHAAMFVMISLMIFIIAVYLSLWRVYGDIRMITRRYKHIRYRFNVAALTAALRFENNALINHWERLRQSAQLEVEQFMAGVEQGMNERKDLQPSERQQIQTAMRYIVRLFDKWLQLPEVYRHSDRVVLPGNEEEWGMRHNVFVIESALFEAYYKGALDGFNHGVRNPHSVTDAISEHIPVGAAQRLLPDVTPEQMLRQYEAGFTEGENVPNAPSTLRRKHAAVVLSPQEPPDSKNTNQ